MTRSRNGARPGAPSIGVAVLWVVALCAATGWSLHWCIGSVVSRAATSAGDPGAFAALGASVVAASCAMRSRGRAPDIHDRHVDFVVAALLVAPACCLERVTAGRFSEFFGYCGLDWVALALVVAAGLAAVAGTRMLWRLRAALILLAAAGPAATLASAWRGAWLDDALAAVCAGCLAAVPSLADADRVRKVSGRAARVVKSR
jgi:hypothetical protein